MAVYSGEGLRLQGAEVWEVWEVWETDLEELSDPIGRRSGPKVEVSAVLSVSERLLVVKLSY